mmetsp:Transcript_34470/g.48972  ORF Transcript_34470/g.48972 Transcript_34470/m.48972 type:complete len:340 (-) Transcript_34470:128-1147(-)
MTCTIVVYCGSGVRANVAAQVLADAGFATPIYNGLGVSQWTGAGYSLVNSDSAMAPCMRENGMGTCAPVTPTPAPTTASSGVFCFSGDTTVQVQNNDNSNSEDHTIVLMRNLQIGDKVLVQNGMYEHVYSFGHRDDAATAQMVQLLPMNLELSMDHMVFVEGKGPIPASMVKIGDILTIGGPIEGIRTVTVKGVYAPFTPSGTIVVNNVLASNYISFQNSPRLLIGPSKVETFLSYHLLGHIAQTFHRIWCYWLGIKDVTKDNHGFSPWSEMALKCFAWVLNQGAVVQTMILIPTLLVLSAFAALEAAVVFALMHSIGTVAVYLSVMTISVTSALSTPL